MGLYIGGYDDGAVNTNRLPEIYKVFLQNKRQPFAFTYTL
ncbi:hypothetical protein DFQ01_13544 [Paenibacillus cellulosilyticus]|uniref:Uncharacterized protein n=1 Tax=Paenibacillus cellulosilyticus TaxID=375489 RepID=A0A2V2YK92_9BACL|nr:hypothetical protein DFQ01_13544 [Paenibacillus cellulosilyticus]